MINLIVDEMAVTLDLNLEKYDESEGDIYFKKYADLLDKKLYLTNLLGNRVDSIGGFIGYDSVISWGYDNKQIRYLYSLGNVAMKMQIRFGASALRNYIHQYKIQHGAIITVLDILKDLNDLSEEHEAESNIRLSRIDIAFDFIDEGVKVPELYKRFIKGDTTVFNKNNSKIDIKSFNGEKEVNTIYFNERTSASMLRIYNKKIEQLNNKDSERFKEAYECNDWTRFELELKKNYAHNITNHILDCGNEHEMKSILAQSFIDCFKIRDYDTENDTYIDTKYYQDMISFAGSDEKILSSHSYQQLTDFELKYENLKNNGTLSFIKMIDEAYGREELEGFFDKIKKDIDNIQLNGKQKSIVEQNKNVSPFFK